MLCGLVFDRILELHQLEKMNQSKCIMDLFVILNNGNPGLSFDALENGLAIAMSVVVTVAE